MILRKKKNKKPLSTGSEVSDDGKSTQPNTPARSTPSRSGQAKVGEEKVFIVKTSPVQSKDGKIYVVKASPASDKNGHHIFVDTDDESNVLSDKKESQSNDVGLKGKVEDELTDLFQRLKRQRAERQAIAKEQLDNVVAELEKGEPRSPRLRKTRRRKPKPRWMRIFFVLALLVNAILPTVMKTLYNHEAVVERAQTFFATKSTETPMDGITVVISETESRVGSTIQDRFSRLGATVATVEDVDCDDLDSVSKSVDALLQQHRSIDFLVHTGSLCMSNLNNLKSMASKTVQGYDGLIGGNYLSAFLITQKLLPYLERSRIGTLVQITSHTAKFVGATPLELETLLRQNDTSIVTMLLMPLQYAYIKLSEVLQFNVIASDYPNVRTIEVPHALIGGSEMTVHNFLNGFFEVAEEEQIELLPLDQQEELQESLYYWSKDVLKKWLSPPTYSEMFIGSPKPTPPTMVANLPVMHPEEESPNAESSYLPANTVAVVTSSTLALLTMKTKTMLWDSASD